MIGVNDKLMKYYRRNVFFFYSKVACVNMKTNPKSPAFISFFSLIYRALVWTCEFKKKKNILDALLEPSRCRAALFSDILPEYQHS